MELTILVGGGGWDGASHEDIQKKTHLCAKLFNDAVVYNYTQSSLTFSQNPLDTFSRVDAQLSETIKNG